MCAQSVRIVHTTIGVPYAVAYEFAHQPQNFAKWAAGLSSSLRHTHRGWVATTPAGEARVEFSERNAYGVLDHWVTLSGKPVIYIPLRMIANAATTEIELVLFRQPDMTEEAFARDADLVARDLATLKNLLESTYRS